jgi:hypothetical protein
MGFTLKKTDMEQSVVKETGDFMSWKTQSIFEAASISYSKLSYLKKFFSPRPGFHFFVRSRPTDENWLAKSRPSFDAAAKPVMSEFTYRKVCIADEQRNLIFSGTVASYNEVKDKINVALVEVQVYDYSSCTPLYYLPKINVSQPKNKLFKEELVSPACSSL